MEARTTGGDPGMRATVQGEKVCRRTSTLPNPSYACSIFLEADLGRELEPARAFDKMKFNHVADETADPRSLSLG